MTSSKRTVLLSAFALLSLFFSLEVYGQQYTISGYVFNSRSHETLLGATIYDLNSKKWTTTNEYGFYTITLPAKEVNIEASYVGYKNNQITFELKRDTTINFYLEEAPDSIDEAVVYGESRFHGVRSSQLSAVDIPILQIKSTPTLFGEQDVLKTLQLLPGVQAGNDGTAGLYVRGGGQDENLLLLDGVPVYNVNHALGFFSVFNPDAVKSVTLFKGNFPARFGSRLSSVIDVRTNDGDMYDYHGNFSIGLISSKINVEGPIIKGKTSFNLSARRTYLDAILVPAMYFATKITSKGEEKGHAGYNFYDINAKVNHKFSDRDRLFLSYYTGDDALHAKMRANYAYADGATWEEYMGVNWKWGNMLATARWNHVCSPRLFMDASVNYTHYRNKMGVSYEDIGEYPNPSENYSYESLVTANSGINDLTAKVDFSWNPATDHNVRFGAAYIYHKFSPDVSSNRITVKTPIKGVNGQVKDTTEIVEQMYGDKKINASEINAYVEYKISLGKLFEANVGLHYSAFAVGKEFYNSVQPRLSARILLAEKMSLKLGYAHMSQYVHLLTSNSISLPTDLWVPVTERIKPMSSHQYSAGVFYDMAGYNFSIEGYYKTMDNLLEYIDGASLMATTTGWEDKVAMGRGWSYGAEFLVQRSIGRTTGWIGYTWSKSMRQFDREGQVIDNGRPFPSKYDRRHDISITVSHKLSDRIDFAASWVFNSGNCATLALQHYPQMPEDFIYDASMGYTIKNIGYIPSRNNYRLPAYHRLDLGINFHKQKKHGIRTWNISIYNAYNNMNAFMVYPGYDDKNSEMKKLKKLTIFPIIPSVSYSYKF
ncbi:MAG TPA: TonB-dependent receptor [Bacteroidales bacterium]|nr:TonB-dependent receptor [Bacteroidales bacterium]